MLQAGLCSLSQCLAADGNVWHHVANARRTAAGATTTTTYRPLHYCAQHISYTRCLYCITVVCELTGHLPRGRHKICVDLAAQCLLA